MALVGLLPSQQVRLALLSREASPTAHLQHIPLPRYLLPLRIQALGTNVCSGVLERGDLCFGGELSWTHMSIFPLQPLDP